MKIGFFPLTALVKQALLLRKWQPNYQSQWIYILVLLYVAYKSLVPLLDQVPVVLSANL